MVLVASPKAHCSVVALYRLSSFFVLFGTFLDSLKVEDSSENISSGLNIDGKEQGRRTIVLQRKERGD
jgi:ABC-type glucose/galactose transport system permease subunit